MTTNVKLELGREYPNPEEPEIIKAMVEEMEQQVDALYQDKKMLRQVHTKMHGCVKASFKIEPNLPGNLRVGVFKESKEFNAWVRFSNASTRPKADGKKDIRGAAIKLMGVSGEKILEDEKHEMTQDFLLMSSETFFSRNLIEFRQCLKSATAKSKLSLLVYFINPRHWGVLKRLLKSNISCNNPLELNYWSTQPYRFGGETVAVKYLLKPSNENRIVN